MKPLNEHRKSSTVRADITAIQDFLKSRGWAIMKDVMASEREVAIRRLTDPSQTPSQVEYIRAVIGSIDRMMGIPELQLSSLTMEHEAAVRMEDSNAKENKS